MVIYRSATNSGKDDLSEWKTLSNIIFSEDSPWKQSIKHRYVSWKSPSNNRLNSKLQKWMLIVAVKLTATDAMGFVIFSIASKPSLERRSFVWPGSGSTMGKLCTQTLDKDKGMIAWGKNSVIQYPRGGDKNKNKEYNRSNTKKVGHYYNKSTMITREESQSQNTELAYISWTTQIKTTHYMFFSALPIKDNFTHLHTTTWDKYSLECSVIAVHTFAVPSLFIHIVKGELFRLFAIRISAELSLCKLLWASHEIFCILTTKMPLPNWQKNIISY